MSTKVTVRVKDTVVLTTPSGQSVTLPGVLLLAASRVFKHCLNTERALHLHYDRCEPGWAANLEPTGADGPGDSGVGDTPWLALLALARALDGHG